MADDEQSKIKLDEQSKKKLWTGVGLFLLALTVYNLYSGLVVKKVGIPGILDIEFGENTNKNKGQTTSAPTNSTVSPSPTVSPPEASKDDAFERRKQATLMTWNQMQYIDSTFANPSSETYKRISDLYEQLNLSNVDPVLITHINETLGIFREAMSVHVAYEREAFQIQQTPMYDWQRQDAFLQLQARYRPSFDNIGRKLEGINERDKTLARMFTERYDASFVDK